MVRILTTMVMVLMLLPVATLAQDDSKPFPLPTCEETKARCQKFYDLEYASCTAAGWPSFICWMTAHDIYSTCVSNTLGDPCLKYYIMQGPRRQRQVPVWARLGTRPDPITEWSNSLFVRS